MKHAAEPSIQAWPPFVMPLAPGCVVLRCSRQGCGHRKLAGATDVAYCPLDGHLMNADPHAVIVAVPMIVTVGVGGSGP